MPGIPKIISCSKHGKAVPWTVICAHLMKGRRIEYWHPVEIEDFREVESDWVCQECWESYDGTASRDALLTVVCQFCLRDMQIKAGRKEMTDDDIESGKC